MSAVCSQTFSRAQCAGAISAIFAVGHIWWLCNYRYHLLNQLKLVGIHGFSCGAAILFTPCTYIYWTKLETYSQTDVCVYECGMFAIKFMRPCELCNCFFAIEGVWESWSHCTVGGCQERGKLFKITLDQNQSTSVTYSVGFHGSLQVENLSVQNLELQKRLDISVSQVHCMHWKINGPLTQSSLAAIWWLALLKISLKLSRELRMYEKP